MDIDLGTSAAKDYEANEALDHYIEDDFLVNEMPDINDTNDIRHIYLNQQICNTNNTSTTPLH